VLFCFVGNNAPHAIGAKRSDHWHLDNSPAVVKITININVQLECQFKKDIFTNSVTKLQSPKPSVISMGHWMKWQWIFLPYLLPISIRIKSICFRRDTKRQHRSTMNCVIQGKLTSDCLGRSRGTDLCRFILRLMRVIYAGDGRLLATWASHHWMWSIRLSLKIPVPLGRARLTITNPKFPIWNILIEIFQTEYTINKAKFSTDVAVEW